MSLGVKHFGLTYLWVALVVLIAVGCTSREALESIERAEQLMADNPEEALRIMQGVDCESLRSDEDRARYEIVYSEACY